MAYIVFLFSLGIIAAIQASKPRSVNVALETVLEFDNKDDVEFIDTMQNFLNKLKSTITKNRADFNENQNGDTNKRFVFTDFLADTVTVLKSYRDDDLRTFFHTLEKEIKSWQTRKEFHEITDKLGFRRLIDKNLQHIRNAPVAEIRRDLGNLFNQIKFNQRNVNSGFVANFLNYIYKKESEAHFMNVLNNLKLYRTRTRRSNMTDLKRIIRSGIITVMDPLIKLNPKILNSIDSLFKNDANNETKHDNALRNHIKINKIEIQQSGEKHELKDGINDNEILDYIEDHIKVINRHITSKGFKIKAKIKSVPRIIKNTATTNKYIRTTRKNRKLRGKPGNPGRIMHRPREKKKPRHSTQVIKNLDVKKEDKRKPVLINLASNDLSELKAVEEYLSSTKRNKIPTRPRLTSRRPHVHFKTTKSRKAFRTSTLSAEGLSIEHFGSLFGREFHRKSNDNDTFKNTVANSSLSTTPVDVNATKDGSDILSTEMRRRNNLSRENEYHTKNKETKNESEEIEDNTTHEVVTEKRDLVTESIKIKGDIIIENPTKSVTLSEIESTTSTPGKTTTFKNYNVSIVTKYFNVKPLKPIINLRSQDFEISNETVTQSISTAAQVTSTLAPTIITNAPETDNNIKPNEDGLENEIEGISDRYNSTPMAEKFKKFINNVQTNDDEGNKVRDQMKADLAKIFATPSTKSTVTELFTDPFDDIDDANADLI